MELLDWTNALELELVVGKRTYTGMIPYFAYIYGVERNDGKHDRMLRGFSGNANSIDDALVDMCEQIRGKMLYTRRGNESAHFVAPTTLVHTRMLRIKII